MDSVHRSRGRIFLQLWHVGRISHSSLLPNNAQPVAPSAIRANSQTFIATGPAQVSEPVALTLSGIKETLADYRAAARNAKEAGFDGVEIHAANGYLIDQFLRSRIESAKRPIWRQSRRTVSAFSLKQPNKYWKSGTSKHIGVRISPTGILTICETPTRAKPLRDSRTTQRLQARLFPCRRNGAGRPQNSESRSRLCCSALRELWKGFYVVNGGYDGPRGEEAIRSGHADAIAYGRAFLANPDLPRRLQLGSPLNVPDQRTFYGGDARGYTDYPCLP